MSQETIELDLDGKAVPVPREVVSGLAAAAAAHAGVSARPRDLSLLLGRALESGHARLGQQEVRPLCVVLEEQQGDRLDASWTELLREAAA
jgi:hypothetical protein